MKFDTKHLIVIAVAIAVFGAVVVLGLRGWNAPAGLMGTGTNATDATNPTSIVPSTSEPLTPARLVIPAAPGATAQLRVFDMTASPDGFSLDKIVVNEGDTVSIRMTAGTDAFDIAIPSLGLHQTAEPGGGTRTLEFQAPAAGTYPFMCQDACPGGAKLDGEVLIKKVGN